MTVCPTGELDAAGREGATGEDSVGGWIVAQGGKGDTGGGVSGAGDDSDEGSVGAVAGIGDESAVGLDCNMVAAYLGGLVQAWAEVVLDCFERGQAVPGPDFV